MAFDTGYERRLEGVVRALSTAHKVLRLYPDSSPIPRQSVESLVAAVEHFFVEGEPLISLAIGRDGFSTYGEPVCRNLAGASDFVDDLRAHGVAELNISPGCSVEELLSFLGAVGRAPEELRARGGIAAELAAAGVESVRVSDVQLTVLDQVGPAPDQDIDEFLRELAHDPEKLAAWFAAASSADPRAFEEGLMELVRASGPSGHTEMLEALAVAFMRQNPEAKDALLGLAMEQGPTKDLAASMFALLSPGEISDSILGGSLGGNMLSLSAALTRLPLEDATAQVRTQVQAMLPSLGRSEQQADFLEHMIEVRRKADAEKPLVDADPTYRAVVAASTLDDTIVGQGLRAVDAHHHRTGAAGVRTMLLLLDQQQDFGLYCTSLESLGGMVPGLVEKGDFDLARRVMMELSNRQSLDVASWPDLSTRVSAALACASGPRTMSALVEAVAERPTLLPLATEIVRCGGDSAPAALVSAAIAHKQAGLDVAEQIVGRRLGDLLSQEALKAQWFELAPVARLLALNGEPRSVLSLETLMRRRDAQSRREVVAGLADAAGPVAERLLANALRDSSTEVSIVAARALGSCSSPRAAQLLAARLSEIDIDNADFVLGREIIASISRCPGTAADEALRRLAGRKSLIKRGHFAEVQVLVNEARDKRAGTGSLQ